MDDTKQRITYNMQIIKSWQQGLKISYRKVEAITGITSDQYSEYERGNGDPNVLDVATDKLRQFAFKQTMPNLDMRSAYLLNGIKFEIKDLRLPAKKVSEISGVPMDQYHDFLNGNLDAGVYEDAFDRLGVYYYLQSVSKSD
ncbi:MAG: hypothetical protein ABF679_04125 [Lentilactobacillus diolivorans]|uniref:hypothetical protein n=1 Tax=Lentilactobacillus diolivorans TaxID=179838 RepID=UPI0039E93C9A